MSDEVTITPDELQQLVDLYVQIETANIEQRKQLKSLQDQTRSVRDQLQKNGLWDVMPEEVKKFVDFAVSFEPSDMFASEKKRLKEEVEKWAGPLP